MFKRFNPENIKVWWYFFPNSSNRKDLKIWITSKSLVGYNERSEYGFAIYKEFTNDSLCEEVMGFINLNQFSIDGELLTMDDRKIYIFASHLPSQVFSWWRKAEKERLENSVKLRCSLESEDEPEYQELLRKLNLAIKE